MGKTRSQIEAELKHLMEEISAAEAQVNLTMKRLNEQKNLQSQQGADLSLMTQEMKRVQGADVVKIDGASTLWRAAIKKREALQRTATFVKIIGATLEREQKRLADLLENAKALSAELKTFGVVVSWT